MTVSRRQARPRTNFPIIQFGMIVRSIRKSRGKCGASRRVAADPGGNRRRARENASADRTCFSRFIDSEASRGTRISVDDCAATIMRESTEPRSAARRAVHSMESGDRLARPYLFLLTRCLSRRSSRSMIYLRARAISGHGVRNPVNPT